MTCECVIFSDSFLQRKDQIKAQMHKAPSFYIKLNFSFKQIKEK